MTPDQIGFAILYIAVFLLLGKWIRIKVKWMQKLYLPSSVIGGFLALFLGPEVLGNILGNFVDDDSFFQNGIMTEEAMEVWDALPGLLINVIFASLFLGMAIPSLTKVWKYGGPQFTLGWTIGWGQYVIGILLSVLVLGPLFDLPPMAGALLEIAFEGGHGAVAGLGDTFEEVGFEEAYDLAIGLATIGILTGVIVGIIFINWAVRKNKLEVDHDPDDMSKLQEQGIVEFENREPAGEITVRQESIEPLSLHFAFVGIAILIGWVILEFLVWVESVTWGAWTDYEFLTYLPLFPVAMIGGILVQYLVDKSKYEHIMDRKMVNRIQGFSLDVLILTAIGSVSLSTIGEHIIPFILLAAVGITWSAVGFMVLARRFIPSYWFERGIGDYGQAMGITATGLLLIRVTDPKGDASATESFGYKQILFEPVLGGGLITALSMPLIFEFGPIPFLIISIIMLTAGILTGLLYFGKK